MCEPKEWTLMFYFATDNPLAISAVSQLKAIKDAGFHPDANVVAQFDPYTEGTPTHVFDVNIVNKLKAAGKSNIGFHDDPETVRNMIEDKLWRDERTRWVPEGTAKTASNQQPVRKVLNQVLHDNFHIDYKPPVAPNVDSIFNPRTEQMEEPGAQTSLREFLRFCANKYPAKHYMLFMLGHGVVVGNDIFMMDEHGSEQSLTLTDLGQILGEFKHNIELEDSVLELVSFHSCSVSSMEVAYELQGTAKYLLASQGPAFVGSWPYRQILVRIFNTLPDKSTSPGDGKPPKSLRQEDMRKLMLDIYRSCMRNSGDYLLAGYSFQLTLCDLEKLPDIHGDIHALAQALTAGLEKDVSRDFILLSHWKSQSFFNEMYTDLYDFCFCLNNKIADLEKFGAVSQELADIRKACDNVMNRLMKENPRKDTDARIPQIIVAADSLGPAFQYSRGLSVYFPWAEPSKDSPILKEYQRYRFTTDFMTESETDVEYSWLKFLRAYFKTTKRAVSSDEADNNRYLPRLQVARIEQVLDQDIASLIYNGEGTPDLRAALGRGDKSDPTDRTGGDQEAVSIKNFPRDTRTREQRQQRAVVTFPIFESLDLDLIDKKRLNGKTGKNGQCVNGTNASSEYVPAQNGQNVKT
jgi:cysteine peptidase C11 family protein